MAGSTWPNLTAGKKARASDVESKFDWIEGALVPMSGGSKTNGAYDLGETGNRWATGYINHVIANTITVTTLSATSISVQTLVASGTVSAAEIKTPTLVLNSLDLDTLTADTIVANTVSSTDIHYQSTVTRYASYSGRGASAKSTGGYVDFWEGPSPVYYLFSVDNTAAAQGLQDINLPHGVIITNVKAWWWRGNHNAAGTAGLVALSSNTATTIATVDAQAGSATGFHVVSTNVSATIDNSANKYYLYFTINPYALLSEIGFGGMFITYTIQRPLP